MEKSPHKIIIYGVREVLSLANRLGEKIKDKYFWTYPEMEQSIGYLIYFRNFLKKKKGKRVSFNQIFGDSGEFFEVKHFKRGFNSKSITFKTIVGDTVNKWVLKIGHRISPVVDFGDPSTESYFKQYEKSFDLIQNKISRIKQLSYLLPNPQEVIWAVLTEEGNQTGTTLVIQPFLKIINPAKIKKKIGREKKRQLLRELDHFKKLCTNLETKHNLVPDLLGEGNLELVEDQGDYHLKLLDTGFVDLEAPLPITHTVMGFARLQALAYIENMIKKLS